MTKLLGTDDYEIKWATGYPLRTDLVPFASIHPTQTDAAFFGTLPRDSGYICSVSRNGFKVGICCDGDMKITNRANGDVYRCGSELIAAGFDEDKKLYRALEAGDLAWDMNPWFDLYVNGDHLDNVQHDILEAIDAAKAWIDEEKN